MIGEEEFVERAKEFLAPLVTSMPATLDADTELIQSGLLDSLLVLEFFFFLEGLKGSTIDAELATVDALATLRRAYRLVVDAPS